MAQFNKESISKTKGTVPFQSTTTTYMEPVKPSAKIRSFDEI